MNILCTGDFHLHAQGDLNRSLDGDGETTLSRLILESARWMAELLTGRRQSISDFLYAGGDLTTTPGVLTAADLRLMSRTEQIFDQHQITRVNNLGNHDLAGRRNGLHNLEMYRCLPRVVLAEPGQVLAFRGLHVVPFTFDLDEQRRLLASIPDDSVVAVHIPILGTRMTPDLSGEADAREESGLDPSEFSRFRLTLASHYHVPQIRYADGYTRVYDGPAWGRIGEGERGAILVLGTPVAHSFADRNPTYGVFLLTLGVGGVEYQFVPNPYSPRYITASVESLEELRAILPTAGEQVFLSLDARGEFADALRRLPAEELLDGHDCVLLDRRVRKARPLPEASAENRLAIPSGHDMLGAVREYLLTCPNLGFEAAQVTDYLSPLVSALPVEDAIGGPVQFERLEVENFMSWEQATLDFNGSGLVLIQGTNHDTERADSNGSGKTALLESLVWCLYDSFLREVDSKDRAVRQGSRGCRVEVRFSTSEGTFLVRRARAGNKGGVSLWRLAEDPSGEQSGPGWQDISATTAPDINRQILTVLGIPFSVFSSTTFFGSRFPNKFTELGDTGRKQYLGMAFGLHHYDSLRARVKQHLDQVVAERARLASRESTLRESRDRAVVSLESAEQAATEAAERREAALAEARRSLGVKRQVLEQLATMMAGAETAVADYRAQVASGLARRASRRQLLDASLLPNQRSWQAERERRRLAAEEAIRDLSEHDRDAASPVTCPSCARPLDGEAALRVQERRTGERTRLELRQSATSQALAEADAALASLSQEIGEAQALLDSAETGEDQEQRLAELVAAAQARSRGHAEAQRQSDSLLAEVSRLEAEDPWAAVTPVRAAVKEAEELLVGACDALAQAEALHALVHGIYEILGPKAIVSYLLDNILGELNSYLEWLTPSLFGGDCSVVLVPTRTKKTGGEENSITVQVNTLGGSYGSSSDGEQRKVDIAIHLALSAMLGRAGRGTTNLLIGDQIFDGGSLDQTASRAVVETLQTFANDEGKRIYLVSHSTAMATSVQDVLHIERVDGVSRFVC